MVECPMPQDILKRKSKFIANLSVREVCCGACGVAFGLLGYFSWFKGIEAQNVRQMLSMLCILPFLLVGFVKLYDQPFEKIAPTIVFDNFICPVKRKKETHFREFEKYESTRYWIKPDPEEAEEETDDSKKAKKKKKKPTPAKITVKKSEQYIGIK